MKKVLIFLSLLISCTLYAQRFDGGLLLGLNASQVDGDTYAGYNKFGVAFGAYTYTPISDIADIQLEIKYMGKGARSNTTPYGVEYTNNLNYIELPVILRFNSAKKIGLEIGTGFGYLFSSTIKDIYGNVGQETNFNTFDWNGIVGMHYPIADRLFVNLRFSYSLLTIRENLNNQVYFRRGGVFNNVLSICLYYSFNSN